MSLIRQSPLLMAALIGLASAAGKDMWKMMSSDPEQCGNTMSCFYYDEGEEYPERCDIRTCDQVMTIKIKPADEEIEVEMHGKTNGYIAMGFSTDDKMGKDEVYACQLNNKGSVDLRRYWNPDGRNPSALQTDEVAAPVGSSLVFYDGMIHCRFTRPYSTTRANTYNVNNNKYYVMHAAGPVDMADPQRLIGQHRQEHGSVTKKAVNIREFHSVAFGGAASLHSATAFTALGAALIAFAFSRSGAN